MARRFRCARSGVGGLAALALLACGSSQKEVPGEKEGKKSAAGAAGSDRPAHCPAYADAPEDLPGIEDQHQSLDYWLARIDKADEVLLSPDEARSLNQSLAVPREGYHPQRSLAVPADLSKLAGQVGDRVEYFENKVKQGELVTAKGQTPAGDHVRELPLEGEPGEVRVALETIQFRCFPYQSSLYKPGDQRLDKNACSAVRAQEPLRVFRVWPGGLRLAESRYSFGWISADAKLSPPIPDRYLGSYLHGPYHLVQPGDLHGDAEHKGACSLEEPRPMPAAGKDKVLFATAKGFEISTALGERSAATRRPITRRAVLKEAFSFIGSAYGFGGQDGGRDCSRYLIDVFSRFALRLPRHSSWQARAGTFSIEVSEASLADRRLIIDTAAERGLALLHLPGHIMLYLGRAEDGRQMAIHSLGEYVEPCGGGDDEAEPLEIIRTVGKVVVSDLELGKGSSRGSLIERIDRVTVIGKPPGPALAGIAELRPPAPATIPSWKQCRGTANDTALFVSPERPNQRQTLRVIATSEEHPGPVDLVLVDPEGEQHRPDRVETGGPPYGLIAQMDEPAAGRWRAVLADGDRVIGCRRILVRRSPGKPRVVGAGQPVWEAERRWGPDTENLYAVWIERLFDHPMSDDDKPWDSLQPVLRDPERNILLGHTGPDDDTRMAIKADCADLPYTLRAYFAWKMRLPFAFRHCSRARGGRPPKCPGRGGDNLDTDLGLSGPEVAVFEEFANRRIRNGVHSSSARTRPKDDDTDYYPVPLTREALAPGTLFADPYGHLLVIVDWQPQTLKDYGVLIAADAQPDGSVGRRRFWRGSFLFHPETKAGGAGFKAYRPRVVKDGDVINLANRDLARSRRFTRFSTQQYQGSAEDFYRTMEGLINPRPLDPFARQKSLVDAFEEQVVRRASSVENGEDFMKSRGFAPIDMPHGSSIFLTTGPWEDYSTPSRDLRLLIALDTVAKFPDRVEASPERFGIAPEDKEPVIERLRKALQDELSSRKIQYTRSDGSKATRTLAEIVERAEMLEMAYNPNDCIEIRWLSLPDSDELETCKRRAPAEQRARMKKYRPWFETRRRPAN